MLAVVLCKRRLYKKFPAFCTYVFYEIAEFLLLFGLYFAQGVAGKQYRYAFSSTLLLSIALRFGVIDEVAKNLFCKSQFLRVMARRWLQCVAALLVLFAVLLAVYAPGGNGSSFVYGIFVVNRGAAMVQCGLLLALLVSSRFLGLSWQRPAFGIALGLAVLTSLDLAMFALRAEFTDAAGKEILNLLTTGTYLVCVSIWIGYVSVPEVRPEASLTVVPHDEVETWNTELQHLLRD